MRPRDIGHDSFYGHGVSMSLLDPTVREGGSNTADGASDVIDDLGGLLATIAGFPGELVGRVFGILSEEMLKEVQGDWDRMRKLSSVYVNLADSLESVQSGLVDDAIRLADHWDGRAASYYQITVASWIHALDVDQEVLNWFADQLLYLAEEVQDGIEMLNATLKSIVSTVTNWGVAGAAASFVGGVLTGGTGAAVGAAATITLIWARITPAVKTAQLTLELIIHFVGLAADIWEMASNEEVSSLLPSFEEFEGAGG